jgi:hypothetical protein
MDLAPDTATLVSYDSDGNVVKERKRLIAGSYKRMT